jgi:hypothetical protein
VVSGYLFLCSIEVKKTGRDRVRSFRISNWQMWEMNDQGVGRWLAAHALFSIADWANRASHSLGGKMGVLMKLSFFSLL